MTGYELNTVRGMKAVVDRLASYEETGLTPEEIVELKSIKPWTDVVEHELEKYMKLEKEERLVELPCGLGGTVYVNFRVQGDSLREKDKPYPCKVVFIVLSDEPYLHIEFKTGRVRQVNFDEIGKTVFPTKEAAEALLKEQEG